MIVFVSNYLNHHQIPFCEELYKITGGDFRFVAAISIEQERLTLGYEKTNCEKYPYLIDAGNNTSAQEEAFDAIRKANVILLGSCYERYYHIANKTSTVFFRITERPFKQWWRIFDPRVIFPIMALSRNQNVNLLCAGRFVKNDMQRIGAFKGRMYSWGYFPKLPENPIRKETAIPQILWVGRLIWWKRVNWVIRAADYLKKKNLNFTVLIIGDGPLKDRCIKEITELGLSEIVKMMKSVQSHEVQAYMRNSAMYAFPSNRMEGWGAVVNEALGNGCPVVGCSAAGAVPELIRDGENGYSFDEEDFEGFCENLEILVKEPNLRRQMSQNAIVGMKKWTAEEAASRLFMLCNRRSQDALNIMSNNEEGPGRILIDNA